ncbi:MAG: hypothetical protein ABUL42_01260 [Terricaulis silvestris]
MTVCVAAIGGKEAVFGAADRMLTAGDVTFQPDIAKIFPISTSIFLMFSGDASLNGELRQSVHSDAIAEFTRVPDKWLSVEFVKDLVVKNFNAIKSKRAEAALLAPMGLSLASFQQILALPQTSDLIQQIARDLINYALPEVSCIVAGVDMTGPHLYSVHDGKYVCNDGVGFAAIGIGYWHAESELMAAKHCATADSSRTVSAVYAAKRRAEIAPSVGDVTDLVMVNRLGGYGPVREAVQIKLKELYDERIKSEERARAGIHEELNRWFDAERDKPTPEQQGESSAEE